MIHELKEKINKLNLENNKKKEQRILEMMNNIQSTEYVETKIDKEFNKYSKLYEKRFGKKAYIAEPSGTKEQTINAIKECLKRNEDILDDLLYPNLKKDMKDNIFY